MRECQELRDFPNRFESSASAIARPRSSARRAKFWYPADLSAGYSVGCSLVFLAPVLDKLSSCLNLIEAELSRVTAHRHVDSDTVQSVRLQHQLPYDRCARLN